ncbi:MAG: hypothetical protein MMC33_005865 [Icmadophila ericetorum]|nr:hypothetical protein [Icmadophila ericetorum]
MAQQFPLPPQHNPTFRIDPRAALSLPTGSIDEKFSLTPLLTLPPAFGSAYVGEVFSCTLCANNELLENADREVTSVKFEAEMQTPSQTVPLELAFSKEFDYSEPKGLISGESLQKIARFDLREEGNHILAVVLTYSETLHSKGETTASSGRVRSFRKLYQFIARPCLTVRTKASDLPPAEVKAPSSKPRASRYALEAQLENLADGLITLEDLTFETRAPFTSTSLNWDVLQPDQKNVDYPVLAPREVQQVAFLIEGQPIQSLVSEVPAMELTKDGRAILGVLSIRWRSAMGDPGILSTGYLTSKRKA